MLHGDCCARGVSAVSLRVTRYSKSLTSFAELSKHADDRCGELLSVGGAVASLWACAKCAVLLSARRAADRRVRFIAVAGAVLLDVSVYCVLTLSASRSTPASGGPAGPFHRPRQKR